MKNSHYKYIVAIAFATTTFLSSCKLDEYNPSTVSLEIAYSEKDGFEGLINSTYNDLYFFHGKIDFIGPTEMGTDLWVNYGSTESGLAIYDNTLTTNSGTAKVVWNGLYTIVNFCNTAIYYSKDVKGYSSQAELDAKLAEAYFMRAYANFNLVEQFGNVLLKTSSAAVDAIDYNPKRNTEEEFYEQIFADLKIACQNLPISQTLRGRVTKKAAYALLAKAYLQRTRLGDKETYAKLALETAEELINNASNYNCALYTSDETTSGYTKLWSGSNNKSNTESLFLQAIDESTGLNPEGWNRGRTRQYFLPDLGGVGADWGTRETSVLYGRSNSKAFKPSKYLLTSVFDPSENTADTRFAETFTYKFYAHNKKEITQTIATKYGKDASVVGHIISGTTKAYVGSDYFWSWGAQLEEQQNMENDKGLSVFIPNWNISADVKKTMPTLVVDPSDLFDSSTGNYKRPADYPSATDLTNMFPAFRKYSAKKYAYTNQYWMGDISIIRLADVYLTAAEAALLLNNDQAKAVQYVNVLRERAAVSGRKAEMQATASEMTIDYILKERAREFAGEHMRWYDLKRAGKLTKEYLLSTNPVVGSNFDQSKHTKRPIPQSFLDAISNPGEFGTNGY